MYTWAYIHTKALSVVKHAALDYTSLHLLVFPVLQLPQLTQSVQYCLIEPLTSNKTVSTSSCDHWSVRDSAARLLAQIVR